MKYSHRNKLKLKQQSCCCILIYVFLCSALKVRVFSTATPTLLVLWPVENVCLSMWISNNDVLILPVPSTVEDCSNNNKFIFCSCNRIRRSSEINSRFCSNSEEHLQLNYLHLEWIRKEKIKYHDICNQRWKSKANQIIKLFYLNYLTLKTNHWWNWRYIFKARNILFKRVIDKNKRF